MPAASRSRWDAPASRSYAPATTSAWDLRWWIMAAMLTSVGVHVGLFFALKEMGWEANSGPAAESATSTDERFSTVRVQMNPRTMENLAVQETAPQATTDLPQEISQEVPDLNMLAKHLPDNVTLSPQATMPTNIEIHARAKGDAGLPLEVMDIKKNETTEAIEKKIEASKVDLALASKSGGPDQLNMNLPETGGLGLDDFKSELNAARKKGDNGLGGLGENYKSLDEMLEYTGPATAELKAMMPTDLLFDYNSAELRAGARLSLMQLGQLIEIKFPTSVCFVDGHTDTTGEDAYNESLSLKRAEAVKNWLVTSLLLDGNRIQVRGMGEKNPLVHPQGTKDEQQLNRRVEISFQKQ